MTKPLDVQQFINKVNRLQKDNKFDLSSDEDLSLAVMNLISIEEHLFFSSQRTGKTHYLDLLNQVRQMRVDLLKKLIPDYEGENWCISKHLLAASMRLLEVGTKTLKKSGPQSAQTFFQKSYQLYSLFWGLNLGAIKPGHLQDYPSSNKPIKYQKSDLLGKLSQVVNKVLDCCRE